MQSTVFRVGRVALAVAALGFLGCAAAKPNPRAATATAAPDQDLVRVLKPAWSDRIHGSLGVHEAYLLGDSLYLDTLEGLLYRYRRLPGKAGIQWGSKTQWSLDGRPTRDGRGRLFAMAGGKLLVMDEESGAVLGRRRVPMGPLDTIFPTAESLAYAGTDSSVHVINPSTGYDLVTPHRIGANVLSIDSNTPEALNMVLDTGEAAAFFSGTGAESWRVGIGPKPIAELGLFGQWMLVGGSDFYVYCLWANSGRLKWRVPVGGVAVQRPVLSRDRVFVVTHQRALQGLRMQDGALLWPQAVANIDRFVTADDRYVVAERRLDSEKRLVVIDAKTGKETAQTLPKKYDFLLADPADGLIYMLDREGRMACLQIVAGK
jgi:hypothetical protein